MDKAFDEGENGGTKWDGERFAVQMTKIKNPDCTKKFKPNEILTPTQIQGYFSRRKREKSIASNLQVKIFTHSEGGGQLDLPRRRYAGRTGGTTGQMRGDFVRCSLRFLGDFLGENR